MFSPSKDKIDQVNASLQSDFKIEDDEELNKYLVIDLYHFLDVLIHINQPYLTQRIINMIPGTGKSSANLTPVIKLPLAKIEGAQARNMNLVTDQ